MKFTSRWRRSLRRKQNRILGVVIPIIELNRLVKLIDALRKIFLLISKLHSLKSYVYKSIRFLK